MNGITRYMRILVLFDEGHPTWTVAEISKALDTSASTLYRLIREMVAVDMLESTVESRYRLGPLFVEYYRRIKLTDPLVRSGTKFLEPLVAQLGIPCTAILARLYGKTVMCVAEQRSASASFKTSYELGRPMPLLRGATSKAVLSTLSKRSVTNLLEKAEDAQTLDRKTIMTEFATTRKVGICETHGHVDKGLVGIAAPLRNAELGINASLSIILESHNLTEDTRPKIYTAVSTSARMIEVFMDTTTD